MLTLEDIEKIPREYLIPKEVAQVIGCYPYGITLAARSDPDSLGFPVIVIGRRTKIPKQAFLNYMRGRKNRKGVKTMAPEEKSYIIGILTQARCEQQSLILSLHAMDISDQAVDDMEMIYTTHINAIDKTISLLDKE